MSNKLTERTAHIIDSVRYTTIAWRVRRCCNVEGGLMERDVVCGMDVDPAKAAATSEYNGRTYYFCAKVCKHKFDAEPQKYAK